MAQRTSKIEVDVSPEMQIYEILQSQDYSLVSALAEFVDNSVQSFIEHRENLKKINVDKLNVIINVDDKKNQIIIEDNASGINVDNFQNAIKMGRKSQGKHSRKSLSAYGIGMKSAAIWLSDTWTIETSELNSQEKLSSSFNLPQLLSTGEDTIAVYLNEAKEEEHYTRIIITNPFKQEQEKYYKNIILPELQEMFFKFDFLNMQILYNGNELETNKAFLDTPEYLVFPVVDRKGIPINPGENIEWKKEIEVTFEGHTVTGNIMIMKEGSYKQPGLRLLRNNRVIKGTKKSPNRPLSTLNKYAAQRIYGELNLDEIHINFMKTGFKPDLAELYESVKEELKKEPNFMNQVEWYRVNEAKKYWGTDKGEKTDVEGKSDVKDKVEQEEIPPSSQEKPLNKIELSDKLYAEFKKIRIKKVAKLYKSLSNVSLKQDAILAYVGAWSLFESLAACLGKGERISFESFFDKKIDTYCDQNNIERRQKKNYKATIQEIHEKGNSSKHSDRFHVANAEQLYVDFDILNDFLIVCAKEAAERMKQT